MPDEKSHVGEPNRSAGNEDYEVKYLASKHGLTAEQVRSLIGRVGNNREKLDHAAQKLKTGR
jgi:hypothetical protein